MKTVVITGGGKGLGLAQSQKFIAEGYHVYIVANEKGDMDQLPQDKVSYIEQDLMGGWADTSWLDRIHAEAGNIDGLVNNAGVHLKKPMWEVSPEELDRVLNINVKAVFAACGRYVELQKDAGKGAIVNISSMGGIMALLSAAAYVTAKTAVIGVTRSIAVDGAPFGIRTNAVCPGFIDTDMTRAILAKDPERRAKIEGRIPSHKFGTPENIASSIHFLISDESAYVNGVALPIDDGYSIGF